MNAPCLADLICCICGGLAIEQYEGHRKCIAHKNEQGTCGEKPLPTVPTSRPAVLTQPDASGAFPDGSKISDEDIPF